MEKRMIAGIFLMLSFVLALVGAATIFMVGDEVESVAPIGGDVFNDIMTICGVIELIFGLLALLGAVMCFKGSGWGLALVGAIFALLSIGWGGLGSLMGLIGLIFVAISKDEFNGGGAATAMPPPGYGAPPPGYGAPPPGYPPAPPPMEQPPMEQPPMEQPPRAPPPQEPQM